MEAKNLKGRTAILLAAEHGHSDVPRLFLTGQKRPQVVQTLLQVKAKLHPGRGTTCPAGEAPLVSWPRPKRHVPGQAE